MTRNSGSAKGLIALGLISGLAIGVGSTVWMTSSNAIAAQPELRGDGGQPDMGMMDPEAMEKLMLPGEHHKELEKFVGTWKVDGWFVMDESGQQQPMTGSAVHTLEMGGRYLMMKFKGDAAPDGTVFEGAGVMGFDNIKQKFFSVWMDTMSTGVMVQYGEPTHDGKHSVEGTMEFAPGMEMTMRNRIEMTGDNSFVERFYMVDGGDEVMHLGELTYSRK